MGFRNAPDKTGGIVVLYQEWLKYCDEAKTEYCSIDNNKSNYANKIVALCAVLWQTVRRLGQYDTVMLHGTINDYLFFAPFIVWLARLRGKRVVLRKFAGNFAQYYGKTNILSRALLRYALKHADVLCWETKALVEFGRQFNARSVWFPNVRKDCGIRRGSRPYQRRLVFLSRVEKMKGIFTLIDAMKILGSDYRLEIYGPLSGIEPGELQGENYSYHGSVEAAKVPQKLAENDVLILPTKWGTEGYPGVIIEAYGVGVPAVSTPMGAIPEIVSDGTTGFFTPVDDAQALADAVRRFSEDNYPQYSDNALRAFADFDAGKVNPRIASLL
jgi:glycosyltransferase involved in cell wall biosynthesis